MRNLKIQAAVSAALGIAGLAAGGAAQAFPTYAQCIADEGNPAVPKIYLAGSSAAQNGIQQSLVNDLFNVYANVTLFKSSGTVNFQLVCGTAGKANPLVAVGNDILIYYRAEGGSVAGALPIATTSFGVQGNAPINQLQLATVPQGACAPDGTGLNTCAVTVAGVSVTNGPTDSFGPAGVQKKLVDFGITDVEPGLLGGVNYPTAYNAAVYGTATPAQLSGLSKAAAFSQAFGFFINNSAFTGGAALDFSTDTIRAVMNGTYTDWNFVPTTSGKPATTTTPALIYIVNRENGSGSKAATQNYLYGYGCGASTGLAPTAASLADGWATQVALNEVGGQPGGITYAGIDNVGKAANANLANLNGIAPLNLTAATGSYPFWYEAQYIENPHAYAVNQDGHGTALAFRNWVFLAPFELRAIASAPHTAQVSAIPNNGGNTPTANIFGTASTVAGKTTYISTWTRNSNSCSPLSETN